MTPYQRADAFAAAFPKYVGAGAGFVRGRSGNGSETIFATWFGGQDYRAKGGTDPATGNPYYGQFPAGLLERIFSMFPDVKDVLHLFSGVLTTERVDAAWKKVNLVGQAPRQVRFDARAETQPDIVGKAEDLCTEMARADRSSRRGMFDLILADPPYSEEDAQHYGRSLVNRKRVVQECTKVLRPGGTLAWVDQAWPWVIGAYGLRLYGAISWFRSMNHRIRGIMLFEKVD